MKLWKYNSILLIISISLVICSISDKPSKKKKIKLKIENKRKDDYKLNKASSKYSKIDKMVDNQSESKENNIIIHPKELPLNKSFSEISSQQLSNPQVKKSYKLQIKENDLFKHKDGDLVKGLTSFIHCTKKEGIINFVKSIDKSKGLLNAIPVRAVLTPKSFSIFITEKDNSLYTSASIDEIKMVTENYPGTNCFNIVTNKLVNGKLVIEKDRIVICGKKVREWVKAISDFKECNQPKRTGTSTKPKVLVDFSKVNTVVKAKSAPQPISRSTRLSNNPNSSNELAPLYYENKCNSNIKSPMADAEQKNVKRHMNKIMEELKKGEIAEKQTRRKYCDKLLEAKKQTADLEKRKEMIEKSIAKREREEKEKMDLISRNKKKLKEAELLKAVSNKLKKMKEKELEETRKDYDKKIQTEKEKAQINAQSVMNLVAKRDKLMDYSKCITKKLTNFENEAYISQTCTELFGSARKSTCQIKKNFCNMCCESFIGFKYLDRRVQCKDQCTTLVNGKTEFKIKETQQ